MEILTGARIGKLKSDRGGEYSSTNFITHLKQQGIEEEKGPAKQPTATSIQEQFFRTLLACMRTQIEQSGIPMFLWGELAMYSSLQINCTPSRAINHKTPLHLLWSISQGHVHPFDFCQSKTFGCLCFSPFKTDHPNLDPPPIV